MGAAVSVATSYKDGYLSREESEPVNQAWRTRGGTQRACVWGALRTPGWGIRRELGKLLRTVPIDGKGPEAGRPPQLVTLSTQCQVARAKVNEG